MKVNVYGIAREGSNTTFETTVTVRPCELHEDVLERGAAQLIDRWGDGFIRFWSGAPYEGLMEDKNPTENFDSQSSRDEFFTIEMFCEECEISFYVPGQILYISDSEIEYESTHGYAVQPICPNDDLSGTHGVSLVG